MASEVLCCLLRVNVVLSLAIILALCSRRQVRRWFGPERAYALWLIAPLALLGAFLPAREGSGHQGFVEATAAGALSPLTQSPFTQDMLLALWVAGLGFSMVQVWRRRSRFLAEIGAGSAGPAIVGIVHPRLVTPSDFKTRFSPDAQILIRAHERAHMERFDARWNALALLLRCLFWFNPIVHYAARAIQMDQELACDAVVMERYPSHRRSYAEALLSALPAGVMSPLGCHWSLPGVHPVVLRLSTLANGSLPRGRDDVWIALVLTMWTGALIAAWAAQPPDRAAYRYAIQYINYTGRTLPGTSKAIWRIAITPN